MERAAPRKKREKEEAARQQELVPLWAALADPTRRRMLDLLRERPRTTGELAEEFPSSRFAVMKHLNVLEAAGLVAARREGRERWNHLNAVPLQLLYDRWVQPYQAHWAGRLTKLRTNLEGENMDARTTTLTQVELEILIQAPRERVWRALLEETTFWWPKDFYTSEKTQGFHIEAKLGGRMYEDYSDGAGVIWYEIFAFNPPQALDLRGYLAIPYGPALSLLHLELTPSGRQTILRLSDSTMGTAKDDAKTKADGWKQLFEGGLKRYVEKQAQTKK
jgi:DNA-binding transcriptional ArsR family regulator